MNREKWIYNGRYLSYVCEENARGWYMNGFRLCNDRTDDLRGEYGIRLTLKEQEKPVRIKVVGTGYVNRAQLNEEKTIHPAIETCVPAGTREIVLPFADFVYWKGRQLFWGYFKSFEIEGAVEKAEIIGGDPLRVSCPVYSRYGRVGEILSYDMEVENCSRRPVQVRIEQEKFGWENCTVSLSEQDIFCYAGMPENRTAAREIVLAAGEKKSVRVLVRVGDRLVPGGRETQTLHLVPDGHFDRKQTCRLITGCRVEGPHIIHTKEGWQQVRDKIRDYDWAAEDFERYRKTAEEWVPTCAQKDRYAVVQEQNSQNGFYDAVQTEYCMNTAIAYAVTGRKAYAEKCLTLIRTVEERYCVSRRLCIQSLVQEGHTFQHLAMACDILWDEGFLDAEDKKKLEKCFRLFMDIVDKELYLGGISNHYIAEIVGCIACALCLQDAERIERFVYGHGGLMMHLARGVFDDGWYYECALGYNLWVLALYLQTGMALERMGYFILQEKVPALYSPNINIAAEELYGITMEQWGPAHKCYRGIEMMLDGMMSYADYRGVVFAMNDSVEQGIYNRRHGFMPYDMAYSIYGKPEYGYLASLAPLRDCLYGAAEIPAFDGSVLYGKSVHCDNAGYAVLRSQNGPEEKRIQAVLHYGSHGGYHGHFDRLDLVSLMRYGRSFYYPEIIWYNYDSHLYKFLIQNSLTHNMVVVDGKNQEAVPAEELIFYSGNRMQVSSVRLTARWANPPYGGMTYGPEQGFEEKALEEGRTFAFPETPPAYGEITGYTEPVTQYRTMVVTDEYVLIRDLSYAGECLQKAGKAMHHYDYMYQAQGLEEVLGAVQSGHRNQLDTSPLSSGQFVTDCAVYRPKQEQVRLFFDMDPDADQSEAVRQYVKDNGRLKMDLHLLNAGQSEIIVGRTPVNRRVHKKIHYELCQNGRLLAGGDTGAWILGAVTLDAEVDGEGPVQLKLRVEKFADTRPESNNTVYLADACVSVEEHRQSLNSLSYETVNTLNSVKNPYMEDSLQAKKEIIIEGNHYTDFICMTPEDYDKEAVLFWDPQGKAGRFHCVLGCDYPPVMPEKERQTIAIRKEGDHCEFITLIELYEEERAVREAEYMAKEHKARIRLQDGTVQEIFFPTEGEGPVRLREYDSAGEIAAEEKTR